MAQQSQPWPGTTTGDAGPYSHTEWALAWRKMHHASRADIGIFPLSNSSIGSQPLRVQATGPASAAVDVLQGSAIVDGIFYHSTATETLAIAANASGNTRIDSIVLRRDDIAQTIRLAVKQGTPAASPVPPAVTQTSGTMWEIALADVTVVNGFTSITNDDIRPRQQYVASPHHIIPDLENNSGATLEAGQVVIWDSTANSAVTRTTTANNVRVAGVVVGRTQAGDKVRVITRGIAYVQVTATVSRGQWLTTSTTAGVAAPASGDIKGAVGFALEARTGAGLVLAYVDVEYGRDFSQYRFNEGADYSITNVTSFTDIDATDLQRTLVTRGGKVRVVFNGVLTHSANGSYTYFDVLIDGTTLVGGDDGLTVWGFSGATNGERANVGFNSVIVNLPAGTHTFKLQWKQNTNFTTTLYAGAGTATFDVHPTFYVEEI